MKPDKKLILQWTKHVNWGHVILGPCYKVLATLRKIKNMTPQKTKKSLVQSLVLSKLNFNDSVTYLLPAEISLVKGTFQVATLFIALPANVRRVQT